MMITIGELIDCLRDCKADARVQFDFPGSMRPTTIGSYRGYYNQPALGYEVDSWGDDERVTAHTFADSLENALGQTYTGWKGGEYRYDKTDELFVANPGEADSVLVSGVMDEGYMATILTKYRPS